MNRDETRKISEWYNTLSTSYDDLYDKEQSIKHDRIIELLKKRTIGTLIDIGCGTGTFLRSAQKLYTFGIGIDLSRGMLHAAKRKIAKNNDLIQAVSSSLPIRSASVDCIVSISAGTADSGLPEFVAEIERISHNDSLLAITVFHGLQTSVEPIAAKFIHTSKISSRETLYFLELALLSTNNQKSS